MKYTEVMVAYNPAWTTNPQSVAGKIRVGPWPDNTGWSDDYDFTVGACFAKIHRMNADRQAMMVFIDFHHAVVRDGIDPMVAHKAFLAIDEYRDHLAEDCMESVLPKEMRR